MLIIFALLFSFALLVLSVVFGVYIGFALLASFVVFALIAVKNGKSVYDIGHFAINGAKKGLQVVLTMLLIGVLTASWMASGTVGTLVHYLLRVISPEMFLLFCFLIPLAVSFVLGSAFATCSTVGVILIVLANTGGVSAAMAAGIILAGAYFGDRASPVSATLNLVSGLTRTNHYKNVGIMLKTSAVPVIIAAAVYFLWSIRCPLSADSIPLSAEIGQAFRLSPLCLLPAALILTLTVCRVKVKYAIAASAACAVALAMAFQGRGALEMLKYMWSGFSLPDSSPLRDIIKGGGLVGQIKNSLVILIACALSELFQKAGMLSGLTRLLSKPCGRFVLFLRSLALGIVTSACGCSQTLAIVMTTELVAPEYLARGLPNEELATDIGLGALIVPAIVPWNVAAFMAVGVLGVTGMGYMKYILFLYLVPIYGVVRFGVMEVRKRRRKLEPRA